MRVLADLTGYVKLKRQSFNPGDRWGRVGGMPGPATHVAKGTDHRTEFRGERVFLS